jgi:DNA-binding NarL/FixJ family response regulator
MDHYRNLNSSRKSISVILFTKYKLIRDQLSVLLENKTEIVVKGVASTAKELLQKCSASKPDVVLFCLMDDETENIEVMPQLFELSPQTKALILSTINGKLDQTKVLKLGATGIVGANQKEEILIRAIRQVSEGEIYLNQKLIAQLLGGGENTDNEINSNNSSDKHLGLYNNDPLTNRELEVIEVIATGLTNKEISKKLFISEATVRHHLSSIYSKLHVDDRLNLVIYAYQNNIVKSKDQ